MNVLPLLTPRSLLRHRIVIFFCALVVSLAVSVFSSTPAEERIVWRTGEAFRHQLDSTIGFQWESIPIREALHGLATNQRIAIWLDRRVDPDHNVDLAVNDSSLDVALQRVGSAIGGGVSYVGSVAYVGSQPVAARLATLAALRRDDAKQLPTAARTRFASNSDWTWEALATPRELLGQLAQQAGATVVNMDEIPHDLWPAGDLPTMPLTDLITLLLAGFDLTFEFSSDGSAMRLVPMPTQVVIERSYAARGSLNATETAIASAFPQVGIKKVGARLAITGKFEEHEAIERMLSGEPVRRVEPTAGSKRFDLRVENQPIGAIIKAVTEREMLQLRIEPAIQAKLQQRISLDVKQLTLEELLDRALESAHVAHRIQEGVLELRAQQ